LTACPTSTNLQPFNKYYAKEKKMHKISILWGECPEDGQEAVTYSFDTEAELNAFNFGIACADGWLGFDDTVPEGYVYREEEEDA
tara:strand:- start:241 stop:495 length:255 start_codon:yes stop_codon:yes gene_type:complete